jgi:hypothetical protein
MKETRYTETAALKPQSCQIDLTHLADDRRFIEWELNDSYPIEKLRGKIVLRVNYDATDKFCCLTEQSFAQPIPLGFFFEGDRSKPVCPTHATQTGFVMQLADFLALCYTLDDEENLKSRIPNAFISASVHEDHWLNSGPNEKDWIEAVDRSFRKEVTSDYARFIERRKEEHEKQWATDDARKAAREKQLVLDFSDPVAGISIEEAIEFLNRKEAA